MPGARRGIGAPRHRYTPGELVVIYSASQWARDFLIEIGRPVTGENERAIVSWEVAESGHIPSAAQFNPLNTTQTGFPGEWPFNVNSGYPVMNYATYADGIHANAKAIRNGFYGRILAALDAGDNAQAVVDAVIASPWGTKHIHLFDQIGPLPPPAQGETVQIVLSPHKPTLPGRRPSAKWDPANPDEVILENGASIRLDQPGPTGTRRWHPVDAHGHTVVPLGARGEGIAPTIDRKGRPDGKGIVMLFAGSLTYIGLWS